MDVCVCAVLLVVLAGAVNSHGPLDGRRTGSYLRDPSNVHNKEHIREHMSDYYKEDDMAEQLDLESEESTRFHYFKLHDYDNNNKLDGLELYAAIAHYADHEGEAGEESMLQHEQITKLVDVVLEQDDINEDGFVDYYEFVKVQEDMAAKQEEA